MVDKPLAACGILVSHETVRQRALKFGQGFANSLLHGGGRCVNPQWFAALISAATCCFFHFLLLYTRAD